MNRLWRDAGASDRDREEVTDQDELGEDDDSFELADLRTSFDSLETRYHKKVAKLDRLKAKLRWNKRQKRVLQKDNQVLRNRNAILKKELQACKDDLFRMQPASQITDSTIAQNFESLDDAINDWIDTEIARFTDKWQSKHGNTEPKLFHHNDDPALIDFLLKYPDTGGEYVIRYEIHRCLQEALFGDDTILVGLQADSVNFLLCIEQGMRGLKPPRDASNIRAWRSEALTSLAGTTGFLAEAARVKERVALDMMDRLMVIFPIVNRGCMDSLESMHKNVIALAVELATILQTSTTAYQFEPHMAESSRFKRHSIPKSHLGRYRMIDVETGKSLKPDSPVTPDVSGNIGNQIMTIAPRLCRCNTDKVVPLVQEVVLVELYAPLGRRRGPVVKLEEGAGTSIS